tara:strand:- start:76 stop:291 length:216 start_codon:yes stop_codon:yes gene_type:complete
MKVIGVRDYFKKIFKNKEFIDLTLLNVTDETKKVVLRSDHDATTGLELRITDVTDTSTVNIVIDCGALPSI